MERKVAGFGGCVGVLFGLIALFLLSVVGGLLNWAILALHGPPLLAAFCFYGFIAIGTLLPVVWTCFGSSFGFIGGGIGSLFRKTKENPKVDPPRYYDRDLLP